MFQILNYVCVYSVCVVWEVGKTRFNIFVWFFFFGYCKTSLLILGVLICLFVCFEGKIWENINSSKWSIVDK